MLLAIVACVVGLSIGIWAHSGEAYAGGGPEGSVPGEQGTGRIAVKLAPGARLIQTGDGSLTVIRDWASLESAGDFLGFPLRTAGEIQGLGVTLLEPDDTSVAMEYSGPDLDDAARALRLLPGVLWAEVGSPLHACLVPDDPYYPGSGTVVGQWGPVRVGLPQAWDLSTGSADVIVAVLDTGVNPDIPDFDGRIVSGYSVVSDSGVWPVWRDDSDSGHGSAVAGVAVAQGNNGQGIAGAAWGVKIMPVKISENGESDTVTLAEGIDYAVAHGADVINVSFATPPGSAAGQTLKAAVASAIDHGVVIVAAAGNWGSTSIAYPAALSGVIAVGATDNTDALWTLGDEASNTGSALDLVAPGGKILSYYKASGDRFGYYGGTSMASPLVAGVAALMLSLDPSLSPAKITDLLCESADNLGASGWDEQFGWGLLNAEGAVAEADGSSTTTTTTTTVPGGTTTTTAPTTTTTTTEFSGPRFGDVWDTTTPYWYEIEYLASLGIVGGYTDGLFYPNEAIKRQQFAKVIVIASGGMAHDTDTCPFTDVLDVPGSLYPYHYVAAAYHYGYTLGTTPGHFSPYRSLTRAQLITMVVRAAALPDPPAEYVPPFGNFSTTHYPYARTAAYAGLLDSLLGVGAGYDFNAPATRGEVCAVLYELLLQ